MKGQAVTKVIIPVAGLGTRMLPATKGNPKRNVADRGRQAVNPIYRQ